jgi:hypothetical protein
MGATGLLMALRAAAVVAVGAAVLVVLWARVS